MAKFKGSIGEEIGDETGETSALIACKFSGSLIGDFGKAYSNTGSCNFGEGDLISSITFGVSFSTLSDGIIPPRSIRSCGFVLRFSGSISESDSGKE